MATSNEIVLLTEVVREQYVRYLKRQLEENVCMWASTSRNHHKPTAWSCISLSVEALETRAIKASQAAQLYQRAMVKMIAAVRRNTQECRLADALFEQVQKQQLVEENDVVHTPQQQLVDKSTQTTMTDENYTSYTLCQKIDLFQHRLEAIETAEEQQQMQQQQQKQQQESQKTTVNGCEHPGTPLSSTEDEVAQELAKLFDDEPTDLNALFGIDIKLTPIMEPDPIKELVPELKAPLELPPSPTLPPVASSSNSHNSDLRQSRWPCELYAQRRRLSACLVRLLDADWRCEDALRYKFHMLFGEDSDDEFATHISSPSIDLVDEVLMASCILRIRPWIVRHLMRPLHENLIGNRFLFKKLAKMLANNIVLINPYASERQVKEAVEHLFCMQPRGIQCDQDLAVLPLIFVERLDS